MDSNRDRIIKTYADHVYPGKVKFYQKYDNAKDVRLMISIGDHFTIVIAMAEFLIWATGIKKL